MGVPCRRVLVVDDEKNIRTTLALALEGMGCAVGLAATSESAIAQASREVFDLAFVDLKLADESGLDLVPRLLAASPGLDVVVITVYATIETAVEAMRRGAWDYLPKPFTPVQVRRLVERAAEKRRSTESITMRSPSAGATGARRPSSLQRQCRGGVPTNLS